MATERIHVPLIPHKRPSHKTIGALLAVSLAGGALGGYAYWRESLEDHHTTEPANTPQEALPAPAAPGGISQNFPMQTPSTTEISPRMPTPTPTDSGDFNNPENTGATLVSCDGFTGEDLGNGNFRFTPRITTTGGEASDDSLYTIAEVPTRIEYPRDAIHGIGSVTVPLAAGDMAAINIVDFSRYPKSMHPKPMDIQPPLAVTYPHAEVYACGIATYSQPQAL